MEAADKAGITSFSDDGVARLSTHHFCRFAWVRIVAAVAVPLLGACVDATTHYYLSWPSEMGDVPSPPCGGSK